MAEKRKYDCTVARMAGNIAAALVANHEEREQYQPVHHEADVAQKAVSLARAIIAEVERTEPATPTNP